MFQSQNRRCTGQARAWAACVVARLPVEVTKDCTGKTTSWNTHDSQLATSPYIEPAFVWSCMRCAGGCRRVCEPRQATTKAVVWCRRRGRWPGSTRRCGGCCSRSWCRRWRASKRRSRRRARRCSSLRQTAWCTCGASTRLRWKTSWCRGANSARRSGSRPRCGRYDCFQPPWVHAQNDACHSSSGFPTLCG